MLGAFLLDAWHRDLPGPKMIGPEDDGAQDDGRRGIGRQHDLFFREVTAIQALTQLWHRHNSDKGNPSL